MAVVSLTRSQRVALTTLTMADAVQSIEKLASGDVAVTIGESRERWIITPRGRKEIDRD
jgi:hypothetical protein